MKFTSKVLAASALALASSFASAGSELTLTPAASVVDVGDTVDLQVHGLAFLESLIGGGFGATFAPTVLRLDGVSIAAGWEFQPFGGLTDNASGTLADASFNTFFPSVEPPPDYSIATLHFTAIGAGLTDVALTPSSTFVFADVFGETPAVEFGFASVKVNAVPVPAAFGLLLTGLVPLARRRRGA